MTTMTTPAAPKPRQACSSLRDLLWALCDKDAETFKGLLPHPDLIRVFELYEPAGAEQALYKVMVAARARGLRGDLLRAAQRRWPQAEGLAWWIEQLERLGEMGPAPAPALQLERIDVAVHEAEPRALPPRNAEAGTVRPAAALLSAGLVLVGAGVAQLAAAPRSSRLGGTLGVIALVLCLGVAIAAVLSFIDSRRDHDAE